MEEKVNNNIISLVAENVKKIKAIRIDPKGNLICIGGANGSGKTSTLDAIEMALAGGKSIPTRPLRDGADEGYIILETESLVVTRTFKNGKSNITVKDRQNGLNLSSPQAILDKLCGDLTFDPLAFTRMSKAEGNKTLMSLVGLDFSQIDAARKAKFDERSFINKEVKAKGAKLSAMKFDDSAPDKEVDVSELSQQMILMSNQKSEYNRKVKDVEELAEQYTKTQEAIAELEAELDQAKARAQELFDDGTKMREALDTYKEPNISAVEAQIQNANAINNSVRNNTDIKDLTAEVDTLSAQAQAFTDELKAIDEEKERLIHEAEMPIDGLGFGDDGVTFNGIPFEQCSGAEQLKVSIAMGMALNPELRVLLIRDGSLLDEASLKMVAEMAAEHDYQVFMERVGEGVECAVVLEDGELKEAKTKPTWSK